MVLPHLAMGWSGVCYLFFLIILSYLLTGSMDDFCKQHTDHVLSGQINCLLTIRGKGASSQLLASDLCAFGIKHRCYSGEL